LSRAIKLSELGLHERRRGAEGFMLIEVLVSLAVVAASLAAIGALVQVTARGVRKIEEHAALAETARAIEAGLTGRDAPTTENLSGETAGQSWRVEVSPFAGETAGSGQSSWMPQNIVITVRSPSGAVLKINTVRLYRRSNG
jgi:general secretion pathway protein I